MSALTALLLLPAASVLAAPTPPVAEKRPKTVELHGKTIVDDYFWMRDKKDPKLMPYLKAENDYAEKVMAPAKSLRKTLYREMLGRLKETDAGVPYPLRGWFYYARTEKGKQYPIHCRKKGSLDAPEEIILDVNRLAKGKPFMEVPVYEVSDDGRLLAYLEDSTGFRQYALRVKDLQTGVLLPDTAEKVGSVAWAADGKHLFYTVEDAAKRQYRLHRRALGASGPDPLIYEEKDERFNIGVERLRSGRYLALIAASMTATEWRLLPADRPSGDWSLVAERKPDHEYTLDHRGDAFLIRTNDRGRNFRLVEASIYDPSPARWKELVPHRPGVMLEAAFAFADFFVLLERDNALPRFTLYMEGGSTQTIAFPDAAYEAYPSRNEEYAARAFRYEYESPITPRSTFDYVIDAKSSALLKRKEVPNFDPALYRVERVEAAAADGARVPITVLYPAAGFRRDGSAPIYLVGYGAYGYPYEADFDANVLSLVDRGAVYAIAHIRGGGELGKPWHDQGRMRNKKNSFTDFIAAAEHLAAAGWGARDRIAIKGTSAGGLLAGAVVNMRPELFRAAIVNVPFVDVINTMLDESVPLTVTEFEEWGNPKVKDDFEYMLSYSPYDNIGAKSYPAVLVKSSIEDSQVMYWEPTKYAAKLRAHNQGGNPILLKTNLKGGHGGSSGRYDALEDKAWEYAFLLSRLGIER